jgi:hypothetical protein
VTYFKYRIQVGGEYTYRDSSYALDLLVQGLLEGVDYEHMLAAAERLAAKARGEQPTELAPVRSPVRSPVRAEEIRISVAVVEPPKRRPEEGWHKAERNEE